MTSPATSAVPTPGTAAPDFTLDSTAGSPVTLSALEGKTVLLAFFPLAFTSTCTAELCEMRDDYDQFAAAGVTVLPISVDSVPTLKEYKAKYGMQAELLSDFKRTASQAYGVLLPERFYSNRAYFLIDRDGILRWSHVEQNPSMKRSNAELFEAISQLG